ncbi:hypothetical protein RSOL_034090 [Rhizoctonia solani AG-3 Rhs1AP]|uniref:Uncharacterized protein n=2 Tax=Rhizoctonia solani AG-3 TaxID=1086053 RepID=A0A074RLT8_9AGAM|nr:hypothetical protein RSOL_034090 [Rhizoctonia solani AG-3 Rhs1AP]KEP46290.1 hypothetical protein V565_207200 [Rhizoctonia solani 123E]
MEVLVPSNLLFTLEKKTYYDATGADSLLVYYYQIALALIHGSHYTRRPSLPTELVLHIFYFAQLVSPRPSQSLSTRYTCARPVPPPLHHGFFRLARLPLCKAPLVRTPQLEFFGTKEVEKIDISVKYVGDDRLVTTSRWSDFFLRIVRGNNNEPCTRPNGLEFSWPCFESTSPVSCPEGGRRVIDRHDDVWRYLLPGDQLEVAVQTYAGESQVDKFDAVVRVFKRWEPALRTLGRL